mgnify:CR=1 FL=1|jgi:hypothetical protein
MVACAHHQLEVSDLPSFRSVPASVFDAKPSKPEPKVDPEFDSMVTKLLRIKDPSLVYEVTLENGEKASTVRTRLLRAAKIAGIEVAVKKSPRGGWYVGLMTPERKSRAGRKPKC